MDEQEVRYSFTGDLGNLKNAVSKAMGFLDQYAAKFKKTDAASTAKKSQKSFQDLKKSLNSLGSSFSSVSKQTKGLTSNLKSLSGVGSLVSRALSGLVGVKIGDWLAEATKESISYVENLNLFRVAMGQSADQGQKFIDKMSELYGMDPSNLYRYSGYFYELTDAIGMTDAASATLSLSMTKASNDIASLFNVDIETVVNNLASGMQGMSRSVRKYGMDIRAVTLQQTALAYGLTEQVENMSEADRMALRYLTMMDQVKNATSQVVDETVQASGVMGDFARNIETPANQLRIFKEQVSQLGRAIGNFLIPMLSKLLPIINGVIMAIRTVLTFLSALTGFRMNFAPVSSGAANTAKAFNDVADAAGGAAKAAKELKKTLAPFDEINLLQAPEEDTGSGGGGGGAFSDILNPALAEAIQNMSLSLEDIEMKANKVRDSLLKFFGFDYVEVFNPDTGEYEKKLQWFAEQFETNLINKFPQWNKTITALFDNWNNIIESIKNLFRSLGEVVVTTKDKIVEFVRSLHLDDVFSNAISGLTDSLNSVSSWISEHQNQIANFILILGGIVTAFRAFQTINKYIKPLITLGTQLAPVVSQLFGFVAPILAIVASIALLYKNSESFASSFKNLFGTIVSSFEPVVASVESLVQRIWESLEDLWQNHIQLMVESIGDALAPVLDTLSVLWETVSTIFQSIMDMLGTLWETTVSPILGAVADAITALMSIFKKLWEEAIGPVIEHVLQSLPDLFNSTIKPIIEKVGAIVAGLVEIILALWTNVLAPLLDWLMDALGPSIRNLLSSVWDIVSHVVTSVIGILGGVLDILRGIIDFIAGVFTGDWERAWNGLKEIFSGIWNVMAKVVETVLNVIIGAINGVISLLWSALQAFVNGILSTVNRIASVLGFSVNLNWGSPPPAIGYVTIPTLATGGVVTGPTEALIGEGRYDEAVVPLGNSPQMKQFADSVADRVNSGEQIRLLRDQNDLLKQILDKTGVYLDGREITRVVNMNQKVDARAYGR